MSSGKLRDTFVLLLRESHAQPAALSAQAEQTIRRRVAARWTGRIGTLVVVGALGTAAAGAYGDWSGGDSAIKSPIATPTIGRAVATFPVAGGPEFVSAVAGLKCGDPVPKPHPKDHDVELTLKESTISYQGGTPATSADIPSVSVNLSQTPDTEHGILANSASSLIVARDGVVVGVIQYGGVEMGWNTPGGMRSDGDRNSVSVVAPWIHCPGEDRSHYSGIEPGTYDVMGITRVFSTPESVAIQQTLGLAGSGWNLDPDALDPQGIYLPGSYDCAQTLAQQSPARGCLPDFSPGALYNASDSTVTMLYDTEGLVEEFSAVLVSEPLTVTVPGEDDIPGMQNYDSGSQSTFDSIDQFTCGASASYVALGKGPNGDMWTSLEGRSVDQVGKGSPFDALVFAARAPDGSRVELLPGARLVYLQNSQVLDPESGAHTSVDTVTASSAISADQPFTTDRFTGPQRVTLTSEPPAACPGVDAATVPRTDQPVLVGTWRVVAPDGTVTTVDVASYLSYMYAGG